jgi:glycosyltransferase involved in cell wall biosynthesis
MRVCIDASPLLVRSVGVKTYFYHWLLHLTRASTEDTILAFPWMQQIGFLNHEASNLGFLATFLRLGLLQCANSNIPYALKILRPQADLFHVSNLLRNPPKNMPLSATIYDCTVWLLPQFHRPENVREFKGFAAAVFKRAKGLIAISESTRFDAVRLLGLDPGRIEVIYPGVSDAYFEAAPRQPSPLPRPYILCVGTIEPRKNVNLLLDAYAQLSASTREEFDLVVVGPVGWKSESTMARLQAPPPGVRYLGYIPESDMPAIVAGAAVVAYPSLYEGFGLPVAEAMACGVPVVTSTVSSLPEVVGDGGLLVDPQSVSDTRSALERLLGTPSLRSRLGKCGAVRARALFRWPICAQRSLEFFRKVTSN